MADCERAWGLRWAGLRYFNVAGAGWDDLGDMATLNLIPMVMERLVKGDTPKIFGTDYDTPDGTCIRDYIHVRDLATAHIAALDYLGNGKQMQAHVFNVGTGQGASVREVVAKVIAATGSKLEPEELPRRAGDPPKLIGNATRITEVLGWQAQHNLDDIVTSSYTAWQADPKRPHF
jgi:UDP-glucose 4-epimerase